MTSYRLSPSVVMRRESFGGLLFDRRSWSIHQINPSGYEILRALSRNSSYELTCQGLDGSYGQLSDEQQSSIDAFVGQLSRLGLLEVGNSEPVVDDPADRDDSSESRSPSSVVGASRHLHAPLFVWWDITAKCNLKCKQCYSSSGSPLPDEMTLAEVKQVLYALSEAKVFYIYFLGGEPFARPDFLEVLEHCRSVSLEAMISTNGWFITEKIAKHLSRLGVKHVRVSIDGATEQTHDSIRGVQGSFKRALEAVRILKAAGIPTVGITPTIMDANFHEASDLIDLAHDLHVSEIQLVQVCSVGRGRDVSALSIPQVLELKEIIAQKSREVGKELFISGAEGVWEKPFSQCVMEGRILPTIMGCGAGRTCVAISPNGKMRACLLFQYEIGDLRTQEFSQIWAGNDHPNIQWLRSVKDGCSNCKYSPICSGPCPMQEIIPSEQRKCFADHDTNQGDVHVHLHCTQGRTFPPDRYNEVCSGARLRASRAEQRRDSDDG